MDLWCTYRSKFVVCAIEPSSILDIHVYHFLNEYLISVEFVQLSRGVQVAAGESVLLRCLVNKPVIRCEWSWRSTNSSKEPLLVKTFAPNKDADHDCSVRFKNIIYEEEGLWTCGIRLSPDGILHEAPPATVSLLPSGKH